MNKKEIIRQHYSELGKISSAKLTPEQRKIRARKAAVARWSKGETGGD
jgi:hypothetical protein